MMKDKRPDVLLIQEDSSYCSCWPTSVKSIEVRHSAPLYKGSLTISILSAIPFKTFKVTGILFVVAIFSELLKYRLEKKKERNSFLWNGWRMRVITVLVNFMMVSESGNEKLLSNLF